MLLKDFQNELEERSACAASRGFTLEYQNKREQENNTICLEQLAPATLMKWRLSRHEAINANFSKNEPDSTPKFLKSFAKD
ncbi:hypothetical protein N7539_001415 [Penicillium diatomitis]|uniref:Uncharacterized protein n=1 Tax=Penicillium diatomitis TaxID=2819901 RepID=A0A9X0C066_9EURO|nr:uncharacterized protein N7539_001415 [Penicillium diatomitis]KAJ5492669.1 hypothetical protein N7539_001415 [Penicillium diatomitis]